VKKNEEREVRKGLKRWLEIRQNQALFSEESPTEVIEGLLKDLDTCHEFPWETLLDETDLYYRKPV
jgi:hypothetical protein